MVSYACAVETGRAEFGYFQIDAPRASRFPTAGLGGRGLWEREWESWGNKALSL